MKKWLLMFFGVSIPFVGNAWNLCCPCDWCFKLSGGAEALYWKPYTDDFVYGDYTSTTSTLQDLLTLKPEYDWGFRVFATIADKCYCNFIDVEWASVKNIFTESHGPRNGFTLNHYSFGGSLVGAVDSLFAKQDTRYQKVSAKLGHRFCGSDCRYLYGYLGGRWIHINVKQFADGVGFAANTFSVSQKSSFDGGGVEAGVGGYANLWCGFGTSFRFGGIGAIGDRAFTIENTAVVFPTVNTSLDKTTTRCVGAFEIRADVNYTYCCDCFWVRADVGYELNYYSSTLLFARGQLFPSALFASDFGIGGLTVGLTLGY